MGIPQLFMGEALHGFMEHGSTSFPQAIGLASTWDPALVKQVFTAAGEEAGAAGVGQVFSPVLDLTRDPRWGRTEETYGEDPYLASRMAVAAVTGLQGDEFFIGRNHAMATMKHFAVHGQPEGGTNTAPGNYSERVIREMGVEGEMTLHTDPCHRVYCAMCDLEDCPIRREGFGGRPPLTLEEAVQPDMPHRVA